MVGELARVASVEGSCSARSTLPRWLQTATTDIAPPCMAGGGAGAGGGGRGSPAVGMVGPYREDSLVLRDEEMVPEDDLKDQPGGDNWRLRDPADHGPSVADVWPNTWGVYNEHQNAERDSLNEPEHSPSLPPPEPGKTPPPYGGKLGAGRTLLGILSTARSSTSDMLEYREPFVYLWILLSSLYGRLLVILMLAFCITEVMDNSVKLLSLQGIFLMYLYVGSIAVIICIYIWVLIDSCASLKGHSELGAPVVSSTILGRGDPELGTTTLARFGSLKKAHISASGTSATSFYLRIGALAFGLGTLVFNGLEMAMHSMMEGNCLNDVVFVHPVLHGLFTFLQMHFLFVNSQVLVERFGLAARFGFMHLSATNLALWVRLVVWESGNEWTYFVHLAHSTLLGGARLANNIPTPLELRGFPRSMVSRHQRDLSFASNITLVQGYQPISQQHISQVVALHECLNTNSLGQLWTSSMPFLYPFIVQFSLIAAAVTYVMGQNVGRCRLHQTFKKAHAKNNNNNNMNMNMNNTCDTAKGAASDWSVDCGGATKGLFLGLLCVVAGIVVIIIFLVVKEDEQFPMDTVFWLTSGTLAAVLSLSAIVTAAGLVQVRKLSLGGRQPSALDSLLATATITGVQLYSVFGMVVGASGLAASHEGAPRHAMLLAVSALQLAQACAQSTFVAEATRRSGLTRHQVRSRPARQALTFLLCANAVLWLFDTFVTQSWMSQELQLRFFGVLAWGVVSRVGLPLLVFYRFHSCVLLLEAWRHSYRAPLLDPGN